MTTSTQPTENNNPLLLQSIDAGVCTLTLNHPDKRNALSDALIDELHQALIACDANPAVRVVVIAAAGKVFCSGHDLKEVQSKQGLDEYRDLFDRCSQMMLAITRLSKPVIAQVQGVATAAGCQLVATCDLVVAASTAAFATPGVHIGLFCSTPMVALSRKVGKATALEMLMLGTPIDAATAKEKGLVNIVVEADALAEQTQQWAKLLVSKSDKTLAIGKAAFYHQCELPLAEAYHYTSEVMATNMLTPDAKEGIGAFIDKRPPVWESDR